MIELLLTDETGKQTKYNVISGTLVLQTAKPSFWMNWQWWNTGWSILPIPQ